MKSNWIECFKPDFETSRFLSKNLMTSSFIYKVDTVNKKQTDRRNNLKISFFFFQK